MAGQDTPVALVTGSSRGIGAAIARRLGSVGYHVVVNYLHSEQPALTLVDELNQQGPRAIAIHADVSNQEDRLRLIQETIDAFGRIDVLVNNAGITSQGRRDLLEATEESWDKVFDTNLKGPFFISQMVSQQMMEQPALHPNIIINMNSISAYAISENRADYCIAKAGLEVMTKLFASRLADHGILVYEVCPGVIESDMTAPVKEKYSNLIDKGLSPIRRWGTGDDVATAVEILASGRLTFTTGERLNVDGGFHIRRL